MDIDTISFLHMSKLSKLSMLVSPLEIFLYTNSAPRSEVRGVDVKSNERIFLSEIPLKILLNMLWRVAIIITKHIFFLSKACDQSMQ